MYVQNHNLFYLGKTCPAGYLGKYCETQCRFPSYGLFCQKQCSCSEKQCNFTLGCRNKTQHECTSFITKGS